MKITSQKQRRYQYDVFVSHANANKLDFVEPLIKELEKLGIDIWYDATNLGWGDNWKLKIQKGLKTCRFGILVLSPEFIGREWTERELNELLYRQNESGQKVILPLLYHLTVEEMRAKYPVLGDLQALLVKDNERESLQKIVISFAKILISALKSQESENLVGELPNGVAKKKSATARPAKFREDMQKLLAEISTRLDMTRAQLVEKTGLSDQIVRHGLSQLRTQGKIRRVGNHKDARWQLIR